MSICSRTTKHVCGPFWSLIHPIVAVEREAELPVRHDKSYRQLDGLLAAPQMMLLFPMPKSGFNFKETLIVSPQKMIYEEEQNDTAR